MPTSRKVVVLSDRNIPPATVETMSKGLRALRPLGLRFSVEQVDQGVTTINAWIETPEPRQHRAPRQALGNPLGASVGGRTDAPPDNTAMNFTGTPADTAGR